MAENAGMGQLTRLAYLVVLVVVCFGCYLRPVSDDFDRYMYEAIVRGRSQDVSTVFNAVKHESPRSESSSILDSPQHLLALEPLYAIRPIYLQSVTLLARSGMPIQHAINLISSLSLFGIGLLVLRWTKRPLASILLVTAAPVLVLGRLGTPDGLSALVVVAALFCLWQGHTLAALALFTASLGIRTDNIIVGALAVIWIVWTRKLSWQAAGAWLCLAAGLVTLINFRAASYGWVTLIRWSFLSGARSPAEVQPYLTVREYLGIFARNAQVIATRSAIWVLLWTATWLKTKRFRPMLTIIAASVVFHFVLYPSDEDRYLIWAYLIAGIAFIHEVAFPIASSEHEREILPGRLPRSIEVEAAIAS